MLELQLNTLKKKNEELIRKRHDDFALLKNEIVELVNDQLLVSTRLGCILDIFKEM